MSLNLSLDRDLDNNPDCDLERDPECVSIYIHCLIQQSASRHCSVIVISQST